MGAAQRHPAEVLALPVGLVGRLELGSSELAGGEGNRRGRRGRDGAKLGLPHSVASGHFASKTLQSREDSDQKC